MARIPAVARRCTGALVALALAILTGPAGAVGTAVLLDDVTDPTVVSFTVSPGGADVTDDDAAFSLALEITDDLSGVEGVSLVWEGLGAPISHGVALARTAGDAAAGTWTGTFSVPRHSPPGRYPFFLAVTDRVGNQGSYDAAALAARGLASGVDITDADPDATAPSVTRVQVTPTTVDVRTGAATAAVEVAATDAQSGVSWVVVFLTSPVRTNGGVAPPTMQLATGTAHDGVWRGTATLPRHTPAGRWTIHVRVLDELHNEVDLMAPALDALGLQSGFDVLSEEDVQGPRFAEVSVQPSEVNVHDEDQTVRFRVRVTDNLTGVALHGGDGLHDVHGSANDPATAQGQRSGPMARVSGDAQDGVYEGSFVVPRSSATGLRPLRVFARDALGNGGWLEGPSLAAAGGAAALLVYNVPLPPVVTGVTAGDGRATVRWDPPADDRGAAVTGYVIRESPGGTVVEAPAEARSAVVPGLMNGTAHRFTVAAVNRAGASDASDPVSATPRPTTVAPPATTTPPPPPTVPPAPRRSGYWMVGSTGRVHAFGDARWHGDAAVGTTPAVDLEPTVSGAGYWVVDAAGRVFSFGDAPHLGGAADLAPGEGVTSLSATPGGRGYWLFTDRGRVVPFGDAPFLGDMSAARLNGPVLDSVPTPTGRGYWMVASDGGVFSFGDARFAGSMGAARLNAPVESLVPAPGGAGYWLVASDGGVFAFGARFHGSMGSVRLNRPVTGMVASGTGNGYLMVAEDGGIFAFGDAAFRGSLGHSPPPAPITAVASA